MRVSTSQFFSSGLNSLKQIQSELLTAQKQLSSGKRITTPSDDPIGTVQAIQLNREIAQVGQYQKNLTLLENRLGLEESVLDSVGDVLQRVRELTVQAGDGALSYQDRQGIAVEIRERTEQLLGLMNTRDASGEYLFSGWEGDTQAFVARPGGGYVYQGDDGQRLLQVSPSLKLASTDPGSAIFVDIQSENLTLRTSPSPLNSGGGYITQGEVVDQAAFDTFNAAFPDDVRVTFTSATTFDLTDSVGNPINATYDGTGPASSFTYVAGATLEVVGLEVELSGAMATGDTFLIESSTTQDLLTTLDRFATALETLGDNPTDNAARFAMIDETLGNLDNGLESVLSVRTQIGARLNSAESTEIFNDDLLLAAQETLSLIQDTDFAEAAARLSQNSFLLQAAQQSVARIGSLSLFNFLR